MTAIKSVFMAGIILVATAALPTRPAEAAAIDCNTQPATDVVCQGSKTVIGDGLGIFAFTVEEGGWYELLLFDYEWPNQPLETLSALLTTSRGVIGSLDLAGSLLFFAAPGQYFAQVYADTGDPLSAGLYGVNVQASVVPLPAGLLLFVSALCAGAVVARRFRPATHRGCVGA